MPGSSVQMETLMSDPTISKKLRWTGRVLSGLAAVFLLMDGAMKLGKPAVVVEARGNTRVTRASYLARWRAIPRLVLLDTG